MRYLPVAVSVILACSCSSTSTYDRFQGVPGGEKGYIEFYAPEGAAEFKDYAYAVRRLVHGVPVDAFPRTPVFTTLERRRVSEEVGTHTYDIVFGEERIQASVAVVAGEVTPVRIVLGDKTLIAKTGTGEVWRFSLSVLVEDPLPLPESRRPSTGRVK